MIRLPSRLCVSLVNVLPLDKNKIRVWSALEQLWSGIPFREALDMYKADLMKYFDARHTKEIFIPAFNKILHKEDYILLIKKRQDLVKDNGSVKLIPYSDAK